MTDDQKPDGWALWDRKFKSWHREYMFDMPTPRHNDNTTYIVFDDGCQEDAEISTRRAYGEKWGERFEVVPVRLVRMDDCLDGLPHQWNSAAGMRDAMPYKVWYCQRCKVERPRYDEGLPPDTGSRIAKEAFEEHREKLDAACRDIRDRLLQKLYQDTISKIVAGDFKNLEEAVRHFTGERPTISRREIEEAADEAASNIHVLGGSILEYAEIRNVYWNGYTVGAERLAAKLGVEVTND